MANKKDRAAPERPLSPKKLFIVALVVMMLISTALIYVYTSPSLEERWEARERLWEEREHLWQSQLSLLSEEKLQLELVTSKRFVDHKYLELLPYSEQEDHAIVTVFGYTTTDENIPAWINTLILFQSLDECQTRVKNKVALSYLPLNKIPQLAKNSFHRLGVELRYIGEPPRTPPSEQWRWIWMRTQLFKLTEFSRVLFMDFESIAINNVDHLLDTAVPADHPLEPSRLVFTALQQNHCYFDNPCGERDNPSPRFMLLIPDDEIAQETAARINTKSSEVLVDDFFLEMHELLLWTPFQYDHWDWQVGECKCDAFLNKRVKTISFGCTRVTGSRLFNDVFGRFWTEEPCTHEWFILWMQLYSEVVEKLPR